MVKEKSKYIISGKDVFLEQKKNELLGALYEKKYHYLEQIYAEILNHTKNNPVFTENTEKFLNQIQMALKKILVDRAKAGNRINSSLYPILQKRILYFIRHSSRNITHIDFNTWEKNLNLSLRQKDLIYRTAMTFQLSCGCSHFCRRCNEWALPKVRSHFSYQAILKILNHMVQRKNNEISLFGASDPLDWADGQKNIADIVEYLEKTPLQYSLLTKVPKGKEKLAEKLLNIKANISVSMTSKNKNRIKKIEQKTKESISLQHDIEDLLIPARLDEDFVSVKPSITDGYGTELTLDGAFIIIPTFTSALHPFGHKKIKITSRTNFFPKKKTGRKALLVDYFKPIEGYDLKKKSCYLDFLLDVQIESILLDNGTDKLIPPGMRSLKEYFSIFDEKPRLQRIKMTPAVIEHLKKKFTHDRDLLKKKISSHMSLCKKKGCLSAKLSAVSYFMAAIFWYVHKNPVKIKIIKFLLINEKKSCSFFSDRVKDPFLENLFIAPDIESFALFRYCLFCLIHQKNTSRILTFIKKFPSCFDPVTDIFVPS